jgi:hypothetical protein
MRQGLLLATRSLRSLDERRLFALPTMAKQKALPFGKCHMRELFTRERDDGRVRLRGSVANNYVSLSLS